TLDSAASQPPNAAEPFRRIAKIRGKQLPPDQVERCRRTARELNLGQYLTPGYHGPWWTRNELRLLGKMPDAGVAEKIGRTPNAVRIKRERLGTPRIGR